MKARKNCCLLPALYLVAFTHALSQQNIAGLDESAVLLSRYIQIQSVSGNEREAGEFLVAVCQQKGLFIEAFDSSVGGYNFAASLFPLSSTKPNILLLNHIDVVPAGTDSLWKHPPHAGIIRNDTLWGRGALDMKGMAIMQLTAITKIRELYGELFPFNVTMLSLSHEETDNRGAQEITTHFLSRLNPMAALGEGGIGLTHLSKANPDQLFFPVTVAEKKALWLKLTLEIPSSGHGSVPPPAYANQQMVLALNRLVDRKIKLEFSDLTTDLLKAIGRNERGLTRFVLKRPKLFRPLLKSPLKQEPVMLALLTNTVTLTNITNPPLATNQIAQHIEATLDCRLLPDTDVDQFIHYIKKSMLSDKIKVSILLETPQAKPTVPGLLYPNLHAALQKIYPQCVITPTLHPAYTDNSFFASKGIPTYGINPIHASKDQLSSIHNTNEYITLEQLDKGRRVFELFLQSLATHLATNAKSH